MNISKPYTWLSIQQKVDFSKEYIEKIKKNLDILNHQDIAKVLNVIEEAFLHGKKIFITGNGGSAATASHMASDLQKTTLGKEPHHKNNIHKFKAISLSDNIPVMTAWGNDEWYEYIFSEQLVTLWEHWDVVIIITWSGNSKNLLKTIEKAKEMGITTIGFLWFDWGKAKDMLHHHILVSSTSYWPIEDIHMIFDHLITWYFQQQINKTFE